MKINPYLVFNGDCRAAFTFYAQCLNGTLEMMLTFGESPARDQLPANCHALIMHTRLNVGDQVLMASDSTPDLPYAGIRGCSIALNIDNAAEAERVFNALLEQGSVRMPLEETFWAERFGMLEDRFGVSWMVNCEKKTH